VCDEDILEEGRMVIEGHSVDARQGVRQSSRRFLSPSGNISVLTTQMTREITEEEPPFLHQITLGSRLLSTSSEAPAPRPKCKCCKDSGIFCLPPSSNGLTHLLGIHTISEQRRKGILELCPFCTNVPVSLYGGRYRVVKRAGEGAFSSVYLAQDLYTPEMTMVALKVFHEHYSDIGREVFGSIIVLLILI